MQHGHATCGSGAPQASATPKTGRGAAEEERAPKAARLLEIMCGLSHNYK